MELFNQLDSDGDGYISPQNIDIDHISNEVIELIKPILIEMDENNCMVDFEAFYLSTLHLMQTLSIAERDELFHSFKSKWEERKSKVEQFEHKPQINERSAKIAAQKRPYEHCEGLYQNGLNQKKVRRDGRWWLLTVIYW